MSTTTNGPVHSRSRYRRPIAYRSTLAEPRRWPKVLVLRSSCGHLLGVGYVWKKQGFVTWKTCR